MVLRVKRATSQIDYFFRDTHIASSAFNLAHRVFYIVGVHVFHLDLGISRGSYAGDRGNPLCGWAYQNLFRRGAFLSFSAVVGE